MKKKFKSLIIPLYAWNLFYGLLILLVHQFGIQFGGAFTLHNLLIQPLFNGHQFMFNLGSWFLVPLFFLQCLHAIFIPYLKKGNKQLTIWLIFSILLGIFGTQMVIMGYRKTWWLFLNHILYFLPYFSLGIFYRQVLEKKIV